MTGSIPLEDSAGWSLLDRYVAGECSPAESAAVAAWLSRTPSAADVVATMRTICVAPAAERLMPDIEHMVTVVWPDTPAVIDCTAPRRTAPSILTTASPSPRRSGSPWLGLRPLLAGIAALLVIAAGVSQLRRWSDRSPVGPMVTRTYATQRGQTAAVQLPDGSRVTLAPETKVRYASLSDGSRIVQLDGQAQFDVTHDAARSFVVRTRNGQVRVLGTTFDVRQYVTDRVTDVAVLSGRVSAERTTASAAERAAAQVSRALVLSAGMTAQIGDSTVTSTRLGSGRASADWVDGRLVFKKVPVPVMLATLSRWYGYEFRLVDSVLASQAVTLELPADQPSVGIRLLQDVLNASLTLDEKDKVVIVRHRTTRAGVAPTRNVRTSPLIPMTEAGK